MRSSLFILLLTHFVLYTVRGYSIMVSLMNMRTTLMLMAATMAPIYAQEPAETSAATYARLAAPATVTAATPAQRAQSYPALAYLPADTEALLSINNLGAIINTVATMAGSADSVPAELAILESLTLASGKGTMQTLEHIAAIYAMTETENEDRIDFFKQWGQGDTLAASIVRKQTEAYLANLKAQGYKSIESIKLPPVYTVLTVAPTAEATLTQWKDAALAEISDLPPSYGVAYEKDGFKGMKITLKGKDFITPGWEIDSEAGTIVKKPLSETQKLAQKAIDGRVIYVVLKQVGNTLIGITTENEADIALPAGADESVLAGDTLNKIDANLGKTNYLLGYAAPGISDMNTGIQMAPYLPIANKLIGDIFTELAAQPGKNQECWAAAARSANLLSNTICSFILSGNPTPDMVQLWGENGTLQLQYDTSPLNASYQPGKLALTALPDKPGTILYTESSPWSYNLQTDANGIIDAIISLAEGFVATLPDEAQIAAIPQMAQVKTFLPDLKALIAAGKTVSEGMGNSSALTIDSAGSMPMILGGTPGNKTAIPRICIYSGVTDRGKLAEGWQQLLTTAANIATKGGSDPSVINMLPIVPAAKGNATSYTVAMPWFTPDMVPNITVSDTAFTAGTSSNYNAEVVASATGSTPFTGCVATIKFGPLATTARGIATQLRAIADAEKAPLTLEDSEDEEKSPVAADEEEDEDYYIEEEDYEEEDFNSYRNTSPAEERAENAENIAEALETVAKLVERLDSTSTINNGIHTIRMEAKLAK